MVIALRARVLLQSSGLPVPKRRGREIAAGGSHRLGMRRRPALIDYVNSGLAGDALKDLGNGENERQADEKNAEP